MSTIYWYLLILFGPAFIVGAIIEFGFKGYAARKGEEAQEKLDKRLPWLPLVVGPIITMALTPAVRALILELSFDGSSLMGPYLPTWGVWLAWLVVMGIHGIGSGSIAGQVYQAVKSGVGDTVSASMDWWRN